MTYNRPMTKQYETKRMEGEWSVAEDTGQVEAVVATLGVVDHEGDYTAKGAFGSQDHVIISPWNHNHLDASPVGVGSVKEDGNSLRFEGQIFDTVAGQDWRKMMSSLGAKQQWSYTYKATDVSHDADPDGRRRTLLAVDVVEVSPVTVPAGVGTHTESVKSQAPQDTEEDNGVADEPEIEQRDPDNVAQVLKEAQDIRREVLTHAPS